MESNQNEIVILIDGENEICFSEWNMEDEILNESFQTTQNTMKRSTKGNEEEIIETNFQKLHV